MRVEVTDLLVVVNGNVWKPMPEQGVYLDNPKVIDAPFIALAAIDATNDAAFVSTTTLGGRNENGDTYVLANEIDGVEGGTWFVLSHDQWKMLHAFPVTAALLPFSIAEWRSGHVHPEFHGSPPHAGWYYMGPASHLRSVPAGSYSRNEAC